MGRVHGVFRHFYLYFIKLFHFFCHTVKLLISISEVLRGLYCSYVVLNMMTTLNLDAF